MTTSKRPIGIDLFAGAGGLSLGFEQAGFDVVASVEIDPVHAAVHEFNFPKCVSICESVVALTGDEIRKRASIGQQDVDVVFGGAPCQGFSLIGKRALDDPRNSLVKHFVRLVVELQAKSFVFENVKGLTLGAHRAFLDELIESFKQNKYDVQEPYKVLNAADYGVPQDRKRLFIVGVRRGLRLPLYPETLPAVTVQDALSDLPNVDLYPELLKADTARVKFGKASEYARKLRGLSFDSTDYSYPRLTDPKLMTSSLRTEHTDKSRERFHSTPHGKIEPVSRFYKLRLDGVCNTIRAGTDSARGAFTSPRPIHPLWPRVITVREAARLHSYPDWFRFHVTKWHGFREIGNSVPPLLARSVAAAIMRAIRKTPNKPTTVLELGDEKLLKFDMSNASRYFFLKAIPISTRRRFLSKDQLILALPKDESKYA